MTKQITPDVAFVDAGNLLSFSFGLLLQDRNDRLDSILLAQLATDKKFSRLHDVEAWYRSYTETLGQLAWQNTQFNFKEYLPEGEEFTLRDLIVNVLSRKISNDELSLIKAAIDYFSKLPNDDLRVKTYEKFSYSSPAFDLQVGVVGESLVMKTVGIIFKTQQQVNHLFTDPFSVGMLDSNINIVFYATTLNEEVYKNLRQEVIKKLGQKRQEFILDLDIPG